MCQDKWKSLFLENGVRSFHFEWGGWEAGRLPWEKDVGEIPQGCKPEEARHFPHRKASSFPTTPVSQYGNEHRLSRNQVSCPIVE